MGTGDFLHHGRNREEYSPIRLRIIREHSDDRVDSVLKLDLFPDRILSVEAVLRNRITDHHHLIDLVDIFLCDEFSA